MPKVSSLALSSNGTTKLDEAVRYLWRVVNEQKRLPTNVEVAKAVKISYHALRKSAEFMAQRAAAARQLGTKVHAWRQGTGKEKRATDYILKVEREEKRLATRAEVAGHVGVKINSPLNWRHYMAVRAGIAKRLGISNRGGGKVQTARVKRFIVQSISWQERFAKRHGRLPKYQEFPNPDRVDLGTLRRSDAFMDARRALAKEHGLKLNIGKALLVQPKEEKALIFLADFLKAHKRPPSMEEVAADQGCQVSIVRHRARDWPTFQAAYAEAMSRVPSKDEPFIDADGVWLPEAVLLREYPHRFNASSDRLGLAGLLLKWRERGCWRLGYRDPRSKVKGPGARFRPFALISAQKVWLRSEHRGYRPHWVYFQSDLETIATAMGLATAQEKEEAVAAVNGELADETPKRSRRGRVKEPQTAQIEKAIRAGDSTNQLTERFGISAKYARTIKSRMTRTRGQQQA